MKTTVIHHSADFDGLFCREIARKFLPDAELIGWDFKDKPLHIPEYGPIYIMDLPIDRVFGFSFDDITTIPEPEAYGDLLNRVIWIDHHRTSIKSHPKEVPGYRIDGVAACRLAWQWFDTELRVRKTPLTKREQLIAGFFPAKQAFIDRTVSEPLAVRLAGEYDIGDKRDPRAELFQSGLRSQPMEQKHWDTLLLTEDVAGRDLAGTFVEQLLYQGQFVAHARKDEYATVIGEQGFDIKINGLTFLACCSHECDIRSQLFTAAIKPHHDALCGFTYTGKNWRVSLYQVDGKTEHDLSAIARKYGGGGHAGACGFYIDRFPFW